MLDLNRSEGLAGEIRSAPKLGINPPYYGPLLCEQRLPRTSAFRFRIVHQVRVRSPASHCPRVPASILASQSELFAIATVLQAMGLLYSVRANCIGADAPVSCAVGLSFQLACME